MLTCDWCGERVENAKLDACLQVEFSERRQPIQSWMRFHEECAIRVIHFLAEAIEDAPIKERPDPSDQTILEFHPEMEAEGYRSCGPDGPRVERLRLRRYLNERQWQAMSSVGLDTLLDVSFRTSAQIAAIPGVGATTIKYLEELLHRHGLSFARESAIADATRQRA